MSVKRAAAYAGAGLTVGFLAGVFGIGGGVLFVPVLILLFRKPAQDAAATSLAIIVATGLFGAITYHFRLQSELDTGVRWDLAAYVLAGSVLGSILIGVPLGQKVSSDLLRRLFAVLIGLVGLKMLLAPTYGGGLLPHHSAVVIAGGLFAGAMSGFFGIGGGVINVPLLVMVFGLAQRVAQGTSMATVAPTALAGAIRAHYTGKARIDFKAAAIMAPLAVIGTSTGAYVAGMTDDRLLQQLFGIAMTLLGIHMGGLIQNLVRARRGGAALSAAQGATDPEQNQARG